MARVSGLDLLDPLYCRHQKGPKKIHNEVVALGYEGSSIF